MDIRTLAMANVEAKDYTDTQIQSMAAGIHWKGTKATYANLPKTGNEDGDMYQVMTDHLLYIYNNGWPSEGTGADWSADELKPSDSLPKAGDMELYRLYMYNNVGYYTVDGVNIKTIGDSSDKTTKKEVETMITEAIGDTLEKSY